MLKFNSSQITSNLTSSNISASGIISASILRVANIASIENLLVGNTIIKNSKLELSSGSIFLTGSIYFSGNTNESKSIISNPKIIDWDTTGGETGGILGRLKWNSSDMTMDLGVSDGSVTLQLGQELHTPCLNKTEVTIEDFKVVRLVGSHAQRVKIELAQANSSVSSSHTYGVTTQDIVKNGVGMVTTYGLINSINTNAFPEGSILYLSSTVPGGLTSTPPSSPNFRIPIGICVIQSPSPSGSNGKILVDVVRSVSLDSLTGDTLITSASQYDILGRNGSGLWINETSSGTGTVVRNISPSITTPTVNTRLNVVGSITGSELKIDGNTIINGTFTSNNNTFIGTDNSNIIKFNSRISSSLIPHADVVYNLGDINLKWNNFYSKNGKFTGLLEAQDLNVLGTLTTINTSETTIDSNFFNVTISSSLSINEGGIKVKDKGNISTPYITSSLYFLNKQVGETDVSFDKWYIKLEKSSSTIYTNIVTSQKDEDNYNNYFPKFDSDGFLKKSLLTDDGNLLSYNGTTGLYILGNITGSNLNIVSNANVGGNSTVNGWLKVVGSITGSNISGSIISGSDLKIVNSASILTLSAGVTTLGNTNTQTLASTNTTVNGWLNVVGNITGSNISASGEIITKKIIFPQYSTESYITHIEKNNELFRIQGVSGINDLFAIEYSSSGQDNAYLKMYTGDNGNEPIIFSQKNQSNELERIRISNLGYVGIWNNSPTAILHVSGSGSNDLFRVSTQAGTNSLYVKNDGNLYLTGSINILPNINAGTVLSLNNGTINDVHTINIMDVGTDEGIIWNDNTVKISSIFNSKITGSNLNSVIGSLRFVNYKNLGFSFEDTANGYSDLFITGSKVGIGFNNTSSITLPESTLHVKGDTKIDGNITGSYNLKINNNIYIGNSINNGHFITGSLNISGSIVTNGNINTIGTNHKFIENGVAVTDFATAMAIVFGG